MNEYKLYVYIKKLSTPRLSLRILTEDTLDIDKLNPMLDSEDIVIRKMALNYISNISVNMSSVYGDYYSQYKMKLKYDEID